jgi:hypothetical protein
MQNPVPPGRGRSDEVPVSVFVLIALVGMGPCQAQSTVAGSAAVDCAADPRLPAFEVAAITPVAEKARRATNIGQYGLPHFSLLGVSLSFLLSFSFDVKPANFIDAPRGLDNAVFDVQVKSANGTSLTYEAALQINPSYGCECFLIAQAVTLIPRSELRNLNLW